MATPTHYAPCDQADDLAYCGHAMTAADIHSPAPTCAACAARLAADEALEALIELDALPLDADEAARELDPLLNAGVPVATPARTPFADDLFAFAVSLNRRYAEVLR